MSNLKQMKKFAKMNICSFTFESITWCKITNKKKPNGLPTTAQRLAITPNQPLYNEQHKCVGIITGKQSGITVIDCDDEMSYEILTSISQRVKRVFYRE